MGAVELIVAKFTSHQESQEATRLYYQRLSPAERLEILLELIDSFRKESGATSEGFERVYRISQLSGR
jgi:hypothetical protein